MPLDAFLARLDDVHPEGDQHRALCPSHPDRRPSLIVGERDGRLLIFCRSHRCRPEDILRPLGLTLADLFVEARPRCRNSDISRKPASPLNEARREILAVARRQPWARPGVLQRYRNADLERAVFRITFDTITALQARAAASPPHDATTWRLVAVAAFLEREARLLERALDDGTAA